MVAEPIAQDSTRMFPIRRSRGIDQRIVKDKDLTIGARHLLTVFSCYADENGDCFPSRATLAEDMGLSVRALQPYLEELCDQGFVARKRGGSGRSNRYHVPCLVLDKQRTAHQNSTDRRSTSHLDPMRPLLGRPDEKSTSRADEKSTSHKQEPYEQGPLSPKEQNKGGEARTTRVNYGWESNTVTEPAVAPPSAPIFCHEKTEQQPEVPQRDEAPVVSVDKTPTVPPWVHPVLERVTQTLRWETLPPTMRAHLTFFVARTLGECAPDDRLRFIDWVFSCTHFRQTPNALFGKETFVTEYELWVAHGKPAKKGGGGNGVVVTVGEEEKKQAYREEQMRKGQETMARLEAEQAAERAARQAQKAAAR
jgi:hypothetical protein